MGRYSHRCSTCSISFTNVAEMREHQAERHAPTYPPPIAPLSELDRLRTDPRKVADWRQQVATYWDEWATRKRPHGKTPALTQYDRLMRRRNVLLGELDAAAT